MLPTLRTLRLHIGSRSFTEAPAVADPRASIPFEQLRELKMVLQLPELDLPIPPVIPTTLALLELPGLEAVVLVVTMVRASEPHQRRQKKLVKRERDDRQLPRARVASVAGQKLLLRIYIIPTIQLHLQRY